MTKQSMRKVVEDYIETLRGQGAQPVRQVDPRQNPLAHAWWMCERILHFLDNNQWSKANRWLGHVQGYFVLTGLFTVDEERAHNTTPRTPGRKTALLVFPVVVPDGLDPDEVRKRCDIVLDESQVEDDDFDANKFDTAIQWLREQDLCFDTSYVADIYAGAPSDLDEKLVVLVNGNQFRTDGAVRVIVPGVAVADEDGEELTCQLHFNFTGEGVITDVIDGEGQTMSTSSEMYDELAERLH